jgi:hypothetical protein
MFEVASAPVVPEEPTSVIENRTRFVNSVMFPLVLATTIWCSLSLARSKAQGQHGECGDHRRGNSIFADVRSRVDQHLPAIDFVITASNDSYQGEEYA